MRQMNWNPPKAERESFPPTAEKQPQNWALICLSSMYLVQHMLQLQSCLIWAVGRWCWHSSICRIFFGLFVDTWWSVKSWLCGFCSSLLSLKIHQMLFSPYLSMQQNYPKSHCILEVSKEQDTWGRVPGMTWSVLGKCVGVSYEAATGFQLL